jgi:hypothetical protein
MQSPSTRKLAAVIEPYASDKHDLPPRRQFLSLRSPLILYSSYSAMLNLICNDETFEKGRFSENGYGFCFVCHRPFSARKIPIRAVK